MNSSRLSPEELNAIWTELARRKPDDPYVWHMAHRRIGGRPLQHLPALADIARDKHRRVVVQKSAQVGMTELAVSLALWAADTGYAGRGIVLSVMPTQNQSDDFAQQRFDGAIQGSSYLRRRLQPEPPARKGADNKRVKRVGPGWVFLRGAESQRQIASVSADLVILDEFDQMDEAVLPLAEKRLTSSQAGLLRVISTPRLPGSGINALYNASDQRMYLLRCPACSLEQPLSWKENVDLDRACVVCRACRAPMDVLREGRWIAQAPGNSHTHGYHLSRLYSPWVNIPAMIDASQAETPWALQEFQNADLAEPFVLPNGGLNLDELDRLREDFPAYAGETCVMGVDVGVTCHVIIREATPLQVMGNDVPFRARLRFAGTVTSFAELAPLMEKYKVDATCIDLYPETQLVTQFARSCRRRVFLADYDHYQPGHKLSGDMRTISANRTDVLDEMVDRFRRGLLPLPADARYLGGRVKEGYGEYYREMMALGRTLERDAHGNPRAKWVDNRKADHYFHSEVYCMLADAYRRTGLIKAW